MNQMVREPVAAMGEIGGRMLIGRDAPRDPAGGLTLLRAAADGGDGEAAALLAVLHGAGAWVPQSWDVALDWLAEGATLGSRRAQGQLMVLAGRPATPGGGGWPALRRGIDLSPWFAPPHRRVLCETPRVRMSEAFAPPHVGDWLIGRVRGRMRPAMMYHRSVKKELVDPHRNCGDFEFDLIGSDLILILIRQRIAALTGLPVAAMEPPRVFHYALGQEIKAHYDRANDGANGYGESGAYKGDRIATFLLYLNEGFDGGELSFPLAGQAFKGHAGDAIYFAHVRPDGEPDRLSLHAGLPIRRGEKYVLSQWIHDRPVLT